MRPVALFPKPAPETDTATTLKYRGSYMSALGLSYLTSWGKAIKLEFDKLFIFRANRIISIYHMTQKLI